MKIKHLFIPTTICLFLSVSSVMANETTGLQLMMQELNRNMQAVTDGISREDWELVKVTAPRIASHAQPPMSERMRIASFMGTEMKRFKALDGETHQAARELERAADSKNGQQVVEAFGKLQMTCLNCHQTYRSRFIKHFHGAE